VTKIIQIFDCKVARHGNMIVGRTGSGKSTAWKALTRAMARLKKEDVQDERYQKVCACALPVCVCVCVFLSSNFLCPTLGKFLLEPDLHLS